MNKYILPVTFFATFLFACNNSNSTENTASSGPASAEISTDATLQNPAEAPSQPSGNDDASQTTRSANTGLNPEHGQPGHRCDISVGAPLSSAPAATPATNAPMQMAAPVMTTSPVMTAEPPVSDPSNSASTVTAPGMNPPHGQPGHDCAVAVGAPLNK